MKERVLLTTIIASALLINGCGKKEEPPKPPEDAQKTVKKIEREKPVTKKIVKETVKETAKDYKSIGLAPDFELTSLDGSTIKLSSLKGKVVLLDFWATWCPPCRKMIPELKKIYSKYKNKGVEVIGISMDEGSLGTIKSFVDNTGINYPVVRGDHALSKAYGYINAIPTSFIIDKAGVIRDKHTGFQSAEDMQAVIDNLLML